VADRSHRKRHRDVYSLPRSMREPSRPAAGRAMRELRDADLANAKARAGGVDGHRRLDAEPHREGPASVQAGICDGALTGQRFANRDASGDSDAERSESSDHTEATAVKGREHRDGQIEAVVEHLVEHPLQAGGRAAEIRIGQEPDVRGGPFGRASLDRALHDPTLSVGAGAPQDPRSGGRRGMGGGISGAVVRDDHLCHGRDRPQRSHRVCHTIRLVPRRNERDHPSLSHADSSGGIRSAPDSTP
jgi:hypothetical protein